MGIFSRPGASSTPKGLAPCPACGEQLTKEQRKMHGDHLRTHVHLIESGQGAGGYTWRCSCGNADMFWDEDYQALAGFCLHLQQRHGLYDVIG